MRKCPLCDEEISEEDLLKVQESLKSYLEEEIASLESEIDEIRAKTDDWHLSYQDFLKIIGKIIEESREEFKRLGQENEELKAENRMLDSRVKELSSELASLRDELKRICALRVNLEKRAKALKKA